MTGSYNDSSFIESYYDRYSDTRSSPLPQRSLNGSAMDTSNRSAAESAGRTPYRKRVELKR